MNTALEKLFGSSARVKIIRLFLSNPENVFSLDDVSPPGEGVNAFRQAGDFPFQGDRIYKAKRQTIDEIMKTQRRN